jgi:RND family efflux transporter MFP subunit
MTLFASPDWPPRPLLRGFWSLALGLILGLLPACGPKESKPPSPAVVEVAPVLQQDIPIYHEYVGTTDGLVNAKVRAEVVGYLIRQNYQEGSYVKKGQLLFDLDPRPFEAALEQAKGQLAQSQGNHYTAKTTLEKVLPLAKISAVSKQDRDNAIGQERAARAAVQAAQAAVRNAEINLSFTRITSQISGIAGIAMAQIGDLVGTPGSPELTTVSTVDPIKVYIPISEQRYLQHRMAMAAEKSSPASEFGFQMTLADGSVYPHAGRFYFTDRQVDVRTGTIKVAVLFPNPGNMLRPGQFARLRVRVEVQKGALLVPQKAVIEQQGAFQVAVVTPENLVQIRAVKVGERHGTMWLINQGLKPGESVVVQGVQKVKDGQKVTPKPYKEKPPENPQGPASRGATPPGAASTREK